MKNPKSIISIEVFLYSVNGIIQNIVRVKLGLFNAKIRNENRRYIHRLIYQINEQDLLCHSI